MRGDPGPILDGSESMECSGFLVFLLHGPGNQRAEFRTDPGMVLSGDVEA